MVDGLTSSVAILTQGPEIKPLEHIIEIHIKVPVSMKNENEVKLM